MVHAQPWESPSRRVRPAADRPATPAEPDPGEPAPPVRRDRPVPTNRGRKRAREVLVAEQGPPVTEPAVTLGDDGWRATAETVDRLLGGDRAALRTALERRNEDRLRAAVPLARKLLGDVTEILAEVERRTTDPGTGPAATAPPAGGTLRIARDFPWTDLLQRYGRTNDAGCLAAARSVEAALAGLRAEDLDSAYPLLRRDLRRLSRALEQAEGAHRPLSAARLRALLTAVVRAVETVAIGLLAAAVTAMRQGSGVTAAVFAAAAGLTVSACAEQASRLVRAHLDPPSPAQRLAAAHEELDLAVGDLRALLAAGSAGADDARTVALAQAAAVRRLAAGLDWARADAYVEAVDALVEALPGDDLAEPAAAVVAFRLPRG
jgi:hypothetical protein